MYKSVLCMSIYMFIIVLYLYKLVLYMSMYMYVYIHVKLAFLPCFPIESVLSTMFVLFVMIRHCFLSSAQ